MTNHLQRTRLITPSTEKHHSLDSEDDFRPGGRNASQQQQFFSELHSPGRSHKMNYTSYLVTAPLKIATNQFQQLYPQNQYFSPVFQLSKFLLSFLNDLIQWRDLLVFLLDILL